jgi:hypothetical protein
MFNFLSRLAQYGCGMDDRSSIPGRANDDIFTPRQRIHTGSGAHLASFQWVPEAFFS